MQQEKANYSIKRMARLLKVSRSGYYKWAHVQQKRLSGKDDRAAFYDDVDRKIHQIWKDSDEVYGAPRITAELTERYHMVKSGEVVYLSFLNRGLVSGSGLGAGSGVMSVH